MRRPEYLDILRYRCGSFNLQLRNSVASCTNAAARTRCEPTHALAPRFAHRWSKQQKSGTPLLLRLRSRLSLRVLLLIASACLLLWLWLPFALYAGSWISAQWTAFRCSSRLWTRELRAAEPTLASAAAVDLCVAIVSCRRPNLLKQSIDAFMAHLVVDEPDVAARLVWVDNGSEESSIARLVEQWRPYIHAADLHALNCGLSNAVNALYFSLCPAHAPYVLILEEDWIFDTASPHMHGVLRRAMDVLDADSTVGTVYLRGENDNVHAVSDWRVAAPRAENRGRDDSTGTNSTSTTYRVHCPTQEHGYWGSYTNGASVMRLADLRALGPMARDSPDNRWAAENDFSRRMFARGLCGSIMRLVPGCNVSSCNAAFAHAGGGASSPGWQ